MAASKIYIDTNIYIDILERKNIILDKVKDNFLFISPLSIHIFCYISKIKIPNTKISKINNTFFNIVNLDEDIIYKSLEGPTNDFEDNIQLHSSAKCEADVFYTNDKKLLNMKFFGKTKIENINP